MYTTSVFLAEHPLALILITIWELTWKALALWKAARLGYKSWFIAILLINSLGVLPIIFLLLHRNRK